MNTFRNETLRPLSELQALFPKTYNRVLDYVETNATTISVGSACGTLSVAVDFHLPFTVFLSKEGAPFARGSDLGHYSNLEISMRDGTKFGGNSESDALILDLFNRHVAANHVNKQNPLEVYYRFDSVDCDQVASSVARRFDSKSEAEAYIDSLHENAEGNVSASQLTKEEYINFSSNQHDQAAEKAGY